MNTDLEVAGTAAEPTTIRVGVVDDEPMARSFVAKILASAGDVLVVGEGAHGGEALELVRTLDIDVLLLDLRMPRMDGIDTLRELRRHPSMPAVVVLTTFHADQAVATALQLGAKGFLLKHVEPAELVRAVRVAARGGAVLDPSLTSDLMGHLATHHLDRIGAAAEVARLSARLRDVLRLVGMGRSNNEIAAELRLSDSTVRGYVSEILAATGCSNRVTAAVLAQRAGLLD
ncbi:response regulator [Actinokineospora iranica]|uniref:DNA-binding response regulator, NarL/FixJ family, contains REC and HTH domains n=1 Tax=Actinokineospora iranica TaxID=1271860 RepID=A0A1G6QNA2_9PSEU|nr:response regulator transcription factor [Actinokineospora iranica]SDC93165.1 DNA-binding response regulator, NarL/FixJ family, contains REC and HTH domains [Actinokineospora iranica]